MRTFGRGIRGACVPSLYVFHEFSVVVVGCAGSELKGGEASARKPLHGSVDTVDKVEVLECEVDALVGRASGVRHGTRDDM